MIMPEHARDSCIARAVLPTNFSNSGPVPFVQSGQYGLRVRSGASAGSVYSAVFGGSYDVGGIVVGNASSRGNLVFRECSSVNSGGAGSSWVYPSNAYTAQFLNNNEVPTWTYSQLPSGGNVLEGDEFNISDGNSATWGANVTAGSGGNAVLVRWNGSNWTVVGK